MLMGLVKEVIFETFLLEICNELICTQGVCLNASMNFHVFIGKLLLYLGKGIKESNFIFEGRRLDLIVIVVFVKPCDVFEGAHHLFC
jgi:hypothetical protein